MAEIVLGFPGVGLQVWTEQTEDPNTVVWQDNFQMSSLSDLPDGVLYVCAPFTLTALKEIVAAKLNVKVVYPATVAMGEYAERQKAEGLSTEQVAKNMATFNSDLRDIREFESKRVNHLVLGRGEDVSAVL